jgi:retron-type reverse transcriptase
MKRKGRLFDRIPDWENLLDATGRAVRGKRDREEVRRFLANLEGELAALIQELREGTYAGSGFHRFTIHDPKERIISAPTFRDRVAHHAIMNVCEPALESFQIHRSYACRTGKGTRAAIQEAQVLARRHADGFWIKTDVRKYFDSVPHLILLDKLERRFREPELIALFARILGGHCVSDIAGTESPRHVGLPIGSLISQHLANFYLAHLDHHVTRRCGGGAWLRYMDDGAAWSVDKSVLVTLREEIRSFLRNDLGLELKREPVIQRVAAGMDFLGMRIYPDRITVARRSRTRIRATVKRLDLAFALGGIGEAAYAHRIQSVFARLLWPEIKSRQFRVRLLEESGARVEW